MPVLVEDMEVRRRGDTVIVCVQVNGTWRRVLEVPWKLAPRWSQTATVKDLLSSPVDEENEPGE